MRKVFLTIAVIAGLCLSLTASAQNQQTSSGNKTEPLPRDLEIQLALSALPPHLRDNATVYVLNPDKGFYEIINGNLLMAPAPDTWHQDWLNKLNYLIMSYLRKKNLGRLFIAPVDVV